MATIRGERRRHGAGFSLLEVLIGAVLLAIVAVPIGMALNTSTTSVHRVDLMWEVRLLMDQIIQRIEAMDFVTLWDNFGNGGGRESSSRLRDTLAEGSRNPLLLDPSWLQHLKELDLKASLEFRFLTRGELGVDTSSPFKTQTGILHLQAGVFTLRFRGGPRRMGRTLRVDETVEKSIYCPMILGRPGLLLNQCPAMDPAIRDVKFAGFP